MSERKRVLIIVGTRPEGIKLAPVVDALRSRADVDTRIALTGQHTDLMDQVLDVFALKPDWDLGIMREGQDLYDVAEGCLRGLRKVVEEYRPDMILVQGDTASVFFGALVGFFERTKVGHVEAGLRTGDKWRPYPEEMLRRMTGVVADLHFAPSKRARKNLLREGVHSGRIFLVGNTVVDALLTASALEQEPRDPMLARALASGKRLVLMTAHRRESFGEPLREVFRAVRELADTYSDAIFLYPVHPNPNVQGPAEELLSGHERIVLTEPLDYPDLVVALRSAALVLTDSGGIQEEAPTFGTPVLVLREVTERPEGIEAGVSQLVGTDRTRILAAAEAALGKPGATGARRATQPHNPYGDGHAGERIADIIIHTLTGTPRRTMDWDGL
jgi:UDP-N-acetylglucosamine 2-epimerase (non-hydrolysing)